MQLLYSIYYKMLWYNFTWVIHFIFFICSEFKDFALMIYQSNKLMFFLQCVLLLFAYEQQTISSLMALQKWIIFLFLCSFTPCFLLVSAREELTNICIDSKHHKSAPGPETELYEQVTIYMAMSNSSYIYLMRYMYLTMSCSHIIF